MSSQSPRSERTAVIAGNTRVRGDVDIEGDVSVEGAIEGRLRTDGRVVIALRGALDGGVFAKMVRIDGRVDGVVEALEAILVLRSAVVRAELRAPSVSIEDGARFEGRVVMDVALPEGMSARGER